MTLDEELNAVSAGIASAMLFESDDENKEFEVNKSAKYNAGKFIEKIHRQKLSGTLPSSEYKRLLGKILQVLSDNTGCAEDLEILEMVLDRLHEKGIIDTKTYKDLVSGSSAGRWF